MHFRNRGNRFIKYYIIETIILGLTISTTFLVTSNYNSFASYVAPNSNRTAGPQDSMHPQSVVAGLSKTGDPLYDNAQDDVLPQKGFQSSIWLGDSIVRLVQDGVIDQKKFESVYPASTFPAGLQNTLTQPSYKPILLTILDAKFYENLFWPIGLSNYMRMNNESPLNSSALYNFSSTAGWTFGAEKNGGAYFNKFRIANLTADEEAMVTTIAQNTYRPCCNNPTFFQDCNHGSALLGLLELGASEGLSKDALYREALAFNSFWFPQQYVLLAVHFELVDHVSWANVDPELALSKNFSSASGFSALK